MNVPVYVCMPLNNVLLYVSLKSLEEVLSGVLPWVTEISLGD